MNIKPKGYLAGAIVVVLAGIVCLKAASYFGILGKHAETISAIPTKTVNANFTVAARAASYTLPVTASRARVSDCLNVELLPWNAQGAPTLANGGKTTTRNSLVDKYSGGGCLTLAVQNDYGQMEAHLGAFIQAYERDQIVTSGDGFFLIMGDAYPYVAAALNKLGVKGRYAAIMAVGFSDGEDKCMLPATWKQDVIDGKGPLIAAVPRDGDWNICVKLASDNGIRVNATQGTYDPHAFNFLDLGDWTLAAKDLKAHVCEKRLYIDVDEKTGRATSHGSPKDVCVNGAATWTPGDVDVVENFDGSIVSAASTREYAGQMPALLIGSKAFMKDNHAFVVGLLKAFDQAAQRIRNTPDGLNAMGVANADVFGDQPAAWWAKMYVGTIEINHAGESVSLGGSKVITLQEARDYFGLRNGTTDTFAAVYRVFKGYDERYYPDLYPKSGDGSIPDYAEVVDTSYLSDALRDLPANTTPVASVFVASSAPLSDITSGKSWGIEFDTGTARIKDTATSRAMLQDILDTVVPTRLYVQADGYTDNTGLPSVNEPLSQARAQAVLDWLHASAPETFSADRMRPALGHGADNPACPANDTAACRAQNRRVQITLGR